MKQMNLGLVEAGGITAMKCDKLRYHADNRSNRTLKTYGLIIPNALR